MKRKLLTATLFALMPVFLFAQFSLRGKVIEEGTNESLTGAHIVLKETKLNQISNFTGEYNFNNLKAGKYTLVVSFIGFETQSKEINLTKNTILSFEMKQSTYLSDEVIIIATKVPDNSPTTFTNIDKEEIGKTNLGQDLPILLEMMPSTVSSSDAGAGVGYTGLRIRGSDMTRINITLNGIPLNDAESHSVYWVNIPDFASSIDNIQVQRGVGTSTNGAAAFGASINLQSTTRNENPYAEINSSSGSFNTFKNNVRFGTGLMNNKFIIDGRLSKISSDGYIDRAFSDLKSFYVSGSYYGKNSIIKLNIFSGSEHTYQAWGGVPKDMLETNRTFNPYTYENETDNYQQDHYQLLFTQKLNSNFHFNAALHYTHGEGYYEQFKEGRDFDDYLITPILIGNETISEMDLIQQKWLDNDFYGATYSLKYKTKKANLILGGAWNKYSGDHFGEVIWSEYAINIDKDYRWYENTGEKRDFNIFAKINYQLSEKINIYGDIQFRSIKFDIDGIHDDLRDISQSRNFSFWNPKAGLFYKINKYNSAYASVAVSNREPSRGNYRDSDANYTPKREKLIDYEIGYRYRNQNIAIEANGFFMDYTDQLVLTGKINNVGDPIMTNVEDSYRLGLEFVGGYQITPALKWEITATLSKNKIKSFTSFVESWDPPYNQIEENYSKTDLSFSPDLILGNSITLKAAKNLNFTLTSKYVDRQYIDNTSNTGRSIDSYFVSNLNINYSFKTKFIPEIGIQLLVNNIFDEKYESNAWVYRYYSGGSESAMDGYFPQAGINFLLGLSLKF